MSRLHHDKLEHHHHMIIIGKGMIKIVGRFTLIQNDPKTNNYSKKIKMRDFTTSNVLLYLLIHLGDLILSPNSTYFFKG